MWIYKCNASSGGGDWELFFDDPGDGEWGGTAWTGDSFSIECFRQNMGWRDPVLAYQSDRRESVGLCEFLGRYTGSASEVFAYFRPVRRFRDPIPIPELRRVAPSAFRQGNVRTIYELNASESTALLEMCNAVPLLADADSPSDLETCCTPLDDSAALFAIQRYFQQMGWTVEIRNPVDVPYDLHCVRGDERTETIVRACRPPKLHFELSAAEFEHMDAHPAARLALVTDAFSEPPAFELLTNDGARSQFEIKPNMYVASLRSQQG